MEICVRNVFIDALKRISDFNVLYTICFPFWQLWQGDLTIIALMRIGNIPSKTT